MTIGDFTERATSNFTKSGEKFNLGLPSIQNPVAISQITASPMPSTITVTNTTYFPSTGYIYHTNGGVFGSMLSTPIINPPQSAILGMHNIVERPIALNGEVEIRPVMYLALSYDHRIIDGKDSVSFLKLLKENLEDPRKLFLDL